MVGEKMTDDLIGKIKEEGIEYAATNWVADTPEVKCAQLDYLRARRALLAACGLRADDSDRLMAMLEG
jgi:hypothetical protein